MSTRIQDPIPDWITHLFFIHSKNHVYSGLKQHVVPQIESAKSQQTVTTSTFPSSHPTAGDVLIDLQNVNVKYQDRHVRNMDDFRLYFFSHVMSTILDSRKRHLDYPSG